MRYGGNLEKTDKVEIYTWITERSNGVKVLSSSDCGLWTSMTDGIGLLVITVFASQQWGSVPEKFLSKRIHVWEIYNKKEMEQ